MVAVPTDILGQELNIGDTIAYAVSARKSSADLKIGKIIKIDYTEWDPYTYFTLTLEKVKLSQWERGTARITHLERCVKILDAEAQI